jgi:hypothetical protein
VRVKMEPRALSLLHSHIYTSEKAHAKTCESEERAKGHVS